MPALASPIPIASAGSDAVRVSFGAKIDSRFLTIHLVNRAGAASAGYRSETTVIYYAGII